MWEPTACVTEQTHEIRTRECRGFVLWHRLGNVVWSFENLWSSVDAGSQNKEIEFKTGLVSEFRMWNKRACSVDLNWSKFEN